MQKQSSRIFGTLVGCKNAFDCNVVNPTMFQIEIGLNCFSEITLHGCSAAHNSEKKQELLPCKSGSLLNMQDHELMPLCLQCRTTKYP